MLTGGLNNKVMANIWAAMAKIQEITAKVRN